MGSHEALLALLAFSPNPSTPHLFTLVHVRLEREALCTFSKLNVNCKCLSKQISAQFKNCNISMQIHIACRKYDERLSNTGPLSGFHILAWVEGTMSLKLVADAAHPLLDS
jgi:hypothetical protein